MKLNLKGFIIAFSSSILALLAGFVVVIADWSVLALCLVSIASVLTIVLGIKLTNNYASLTVIFLFFSCMYALSGPLSAYSSEGLPPIFPRPYLVGEFILLYSFAIVGINIGLLLVTAGQFKSRYSRKKLSVTRSWSVPALILMSYSVALLASFFEVINFVRAGGFGVLVQGKAAYQSAVADLTLTLPSGQLMMLSVASLGLSISNLNEKRIKTAVLWFIMASIWVFVMVALGRRGILLALIFIFIASFFYYSLLSKVGLRWFIFGLLVYVLMVALFGLRGGAIPHVLATGEFKPIVDRMSQSDFWLSNANPGRNEFGAAFGNVNTYLLSGKQELRYGETYMHGLAQPIPRFIWPNKPPSATYEFRDTFFSQEAQRGGIAGTAYSSILEAYTNFGLFGVLIIYLIIGLFIGLLEKIKNASSSLLFGFFYLLMIPWAISFHRSSFDMPIFFPFIISTFGYFIYLFLRYMLFLIPKNQYRN